MESISKIDATHGNLVVARVVSAKNMFNDLNISDEVPDGLLSQAQLCLARSHIVYLASQF